MTEITQAHRALANSLPLTPPSFAALFRKAQRSRQPDEIDALRPEQDSETAQQALAFAWAEAQGYLPDLIQMIIDRHLSADFVTAARAAGMLIDDSALQAMIDPSNPMINAGTHGQRYPRTSDQICRILVDGRAMGTGFLIRPRIVATAHHVLSNLMDWGVEEEKWVAKEGSHHQIVFEFGHRVIEVGGVRQRDEEQGIAPHPDWVVDASPCHSAERMGRFPDDLEELKDHYDYVLCRLEKLVSVELSGVSVETERRLGPASTKLTILQHPKGAPLVHQDAETLPANETPYRVRHKINTDNGSSGAPCFDRDLNLLAIHQAGKQNGPSGATANAANVCVPIYHWLQRMDDLPVEDAGLMPLNRLADGAPVYGRSSLSLWVYATLTNARVPAVYVVQSLGLSGLTFTWRVLRDLLPVEEHQVALVDMGDVLALDPKGVLVYLRERMELPVLADDPNMPLSTDASHLKRSLVAGLLDDLAATNRKAWLVLDNFNRSDLVANDGGPLDVFDELCRGAGQGTGLRVIICSKTSDGIEPEVQLPTSVAASQTETLGPPSEEEFETLLRYRDVIAPTANWDAAKHFVRMFALQFADKLDGMELYHAIAPWVGDQDEF